ncbi:uncharacterized protein LOC116347777 [Contarinia nasturtii]|uniref:uncharacterized protein LOC116347777 n=1 Tax=Contarinia nasturtii TaxID=265458 RepID=UPI0012D490A2|nr:uncharacterized protein LOC116347777 [Contarinia nasturtii]XP_031634360.1 uncharacterized protein LOC116347777 [Contarinia nasturtii]XP_031634361.1 uncharacterized protein LOC116347777 [Contarinia nasturtii]XP_031634362.1 uncharacterized protein LOC116347777 [Contarinia nasturtii]XP_031634363.1 uncharacterized protein LOC116347777 [Contarinia nasturtii]XP_031634364.1 uncharacterized protein LOC116347777 [Contarinia nasturtii]
MTSTWAEIHKKYISAFEELTTDALIKINEALLQSGQKFDTKKRELIVKSINSRLEESLDFLDVLNPAPETIDNNEHNQSVNQCSERVKRVRPSLDSNISIDRRSTCSPTTSNQPMASPVPCLNPTLLNMNWVKKEEMDFETFIISSPVWEEPLNSETEPPEQPKNQEDVDHSVPPIEFQSFKRENSMDIDSETTNLQNTDDDVRENELSPAFREGDIMFACFYCMPHYYTTKFEKVYEHWQNSHIPAREPFRFIATKKAACFYCDRVDKFSTLGAHHKHQHHAEVFVVVDKDNKSKCGLCHKIFSSSEMVKHSKKKHTSHHLADIHSPVCLTQNEIEELLTINATKASSDVPTRITAFKCGHCRSVKKISEISFLDHIEQDAFKFQCSVCSEVTVNINGARAHDEILHDLKDTHHKYLSQLIDRLERYYYRTQLMFSNGLVLYHQNLLSTTFDESSAFWSLRDKIKKKQLDDCFSNQESSPVLTKKLRENQLMLQSSFGNNLCITGITNTQTDEQLSSIFLVICKATNVDATMHDVECITQRKSDILVKLYQRKLKNNIIQAWKGMSKKDRFDKCKRIGRSIDIQCDFTPFFKKLFGCAERAKGRNQIQWYYFNSNKGLNVKTKNQESIIIWSKTDLLNYIDSAGKKKSHKTRI